MSAANALRIAQAAGISIDLDGEDLVLQAPTPPARAMIELLSNNKAEIVAMLRAGSWAISCAANGSRAITGSNWWCDRFVERSAHRELGGRRSRVEAECLAWAEMQHRWHMEHGERIPRDICAGCRRTIGSAEALDLIDSSRVHSADDNACLIRHGERWRAAASRALVALGMRPAGSTL